VTMETTAPEVQRSAQTLDGVGAGGGHRAIIRQSSAVRFSVS
jgi:hypothetical protein